MSPTRRTEPVSRVSPAGPAGAADPHPPIHRGKRSERLWRDLVGEQLRDIRLSHGETLRDVATRAGVSPQYLSEIERGRKEPSSEILAAIGGSLRTTLLDLTRAVADRLEDGAAVARSTSRGEFTLAA